MSNELVITVLICLICFGAFILLFIYVSNVISENREEAENSKIEIMNNVMIHMLEQCEHDAGRDFCFDLITSYNSYHDQKFRDAVQGAKHLQNRRLKSRKISHGSKEIEE